MDILPEGLLHLSFPGEGEIGIMWRSGACVLAGAMTCLLLEGWPMLIGGDAASNATADENGGPVARLFSFVLYFFVSFPFPTRFC